MMRLVPVSPSACSNAIREEVDWVINSSIVATYCAITLLGQIDFGKNRDAGNVAKLMHKINPVCPRHFVACQYHGYAPSNAQGISLLFNFLMFQRPIKAWF